MSRRQNQERSHLRRNCPTLGIRFKAVIYRTMDWSVGGVSIKGSCPMIEGFKVGDEVTGTFGPSGCLPEYQFSAVRRVPDLLDRSFDARWRPRIDNAVVGPRCP